MVSVLDINRRGQVAIVLLNRPNNLNAFNGQLFAELHDCFNKLSCDPDVRAIVLGAMGKHFTAGLDLMDSISQSILDKNSVDVARRALHLKDHIRNLQNAMSSLEKCRVPVIAAIHGGCIGAGIDLTSACDIRMCSEDAFFSIKEIDIGIAADIGTLQRFPKIVANQSIVRELVFTGRRFNSQEAQSIGFVSRILPDRESVLEAAIVLAGEISKKSPIAVISSKESLLYSRDHSVQEGLRHIEILNMCMIQSEDLSKAITANLKKRDAVFPRL